MGKRRGEDAGGGGRLDPYSIHLVIVMVCEQLGGRTGGIIRATEQPLLC